MHFIISPQPIYKSIAFEFLRRYLLDEIYYFHVVNFYILFISGAKFAVFLPSQRGNCILMCGNQRFHKAEHGRGRTRWRCWRRKKGCKAIVFTIDNQIIGMNTNHNHD